MATNEWRKFTRSWTPGSYTANSVEPIMSVHAGTLIGTIICRTTQAFNGTGTAAKFELGYGDNVDEFVDDGELEETSVSAATSVIIAAGAADGSYDTNRAFLFKQNDTIDVNFTAATGADGTTGRVRITIYWMRVEP